MYYGKLKIRVKRKINKCILCTKVMCLILCITTLMFCTPDVIAFAMTEEGRYIEAPVVVDVSDDTDGTEFVPMDNERMPVRVEDEMEPSSEESEETTEGDVTGETETLVEEGNAIEESTEEVSDESVEEETKTEESDDTISEIEGSSIPEETLEEDVCSESEEVSSDETEEVETDTYVPMVRYTVTEEEYALLCAVVEAEVTGYEVWEGKGLTHDQIIDAKARVAQVFLNRVEDTGAFSSISTLEEALLQENATSTIKDGRLAKVKITEYTFEAVDKALAATTPDMTRGALFFSRRNSGRCGTKIFTDEVGHTFAR